MCERLGSQIATMPKEVSKQKPFNQMPASSGATRCREAAYSCSHRTGILFRLQQSCSDDDLANAFNPVGFSWIHDDVEAPTFHENRRTGGEIGIKAANSVRACERSPDGRAAGRWRGRQWTAAREVVDSILRVQQRRHSFDLQRISWSRLCDHKVDCSTGLDEADCQFSPCKANEFQCERTKECIPNEQRCNGISSCQDLTDEQNCETCNGFQCLSGRVHPERAW
uniref:Low-density lipoprotein receptor domain class A n=1 Tax=Macrostomum lignano TaxID=282301 RepID=A0A1I8F7R8_9PLAT